MGSGQSKATVLETMLKLNPGKLQIFCEVEWPAFGVGWPSEGTLDVPKVRRVWNVMTGSPGHPDQFPYIDSWLDIAQIAPMGTVHIQ